MEKVKCKMQHGLEISLEWCLRVQYQDLCLGCRYNKGLEKSIYQEEREKCQKQDCQTKF